MPLCEPFCLPGRERTAQLAEEGVYEQSAAHADVAVYPPDVQRDPLRVERISPGEHMLVHAVDEGAV